MFIIKNARVLTMLGKEYPQGGDILMDKGKVVAVDSSITKRGAKTLDAKGMFALPGLVDAHCHIGMWEDGMGFEGDDGNECTDPITPQLRGLDAINPKDRCFEEALAQGVTCVGTGPGSGNPIGGQFVAMKTYGGQLEERVISQPLALKMAFGENPKRVYSSKKRTPETRMATAALIREAFIGARAYAEKMANPDSDKRPERDLKKEILSNALSGKLPVKAHCHRADDIATALRIAGEFGLRMTLEHCTEGYLMLDEIKRAGIYCILGPLLCDRSKIELRNLSFAAPAAFEKAGLPFALMTDHPVIPIQHLIVEAAIAHREGLSEHGALQAITLNAAKAIGLDGRVGAIAEGYDADIALYDAHPLDVRAHVKAVFVAGILVG